MLSLILFPGRFCSINNVAMKCNLILQALQATNGNVEAAIELLFNDME